MSASTTTLNTLGVRLRCRCGDMLLCSGLVLLSFGLIQHLKHGQKEAAEHDLRSEHHGGASPNGPAESGFDIERTEMRAVPNHGQVAIQAEPHEQQRRANDQSAFQTQVNDDAFGPGRARQYLSSL